MEAPKVLIKKESKCSYCGVAYNFVFSKKVYGENSKVVKGGFCSAECYVNFIIKKS